MSKKLNPRQVAKIETSIKMHIKELKDSVSKLKNSFKQHDPKFTKVYVTIRNSNKLIKIDDFNDFPENVTETFNIFYNRFGNIVLFKDIPTSESGDYTNVYTYYFNNQGKTIAYEASSSFDGSNCNEDGAIITELNNIYYDSSFKIIEKEYKLIDQNNKSVDSAKCVFNYRFKRKIYKSVNSIPILKYLK